MAASLPSIHAACCWKNVEWDEIHIADVEQWYNL